MSFDKNYDIFFSRKTTKLTMIKNKKIRIFKFDQETFMKNFFYLTKQQNQLVVILPSYYGHLEPYALLPDGTVNNRISISHPVGYVDETVPFPIAKYIYMGTFVLLKSKPHIFGLPFDRQRVSDNRKSVIIFHKDCSSRRM